MQEAWATLASFLYGPEAAGVGGETVELDGDVVEVVSEVEEAGSEAVLLRALREYELTLAAQQLSRCELTRDLQEAQQENSTLEQRVCWLQASNQSLVRMVEDNEDAVAEETEFAVQQHERLLTQQFREEMSMINEAHEEQLAEEQALRAEESRRHEETVRQLMQQLQLLQQPKMTDLRADSRVLQPLFALAAPVRAAPSWSPADKLRPATRLLTPSQVHWNVENQASNTPSSLAMHLLTTCRQTSQPWDASELQRIGLSNMGL
jgi:hypothetical protein